jgi:hypothetical protein
MVWAGIGCGVGVGFGYGQGIGYGFSLESFGESFMSKQKCLIKAAFILEEFWVFISCQ